MSRVQVIARASADRLILRDVEGNAALEVVPMEIFSIGNQMGGYIARPMPDKPYVWGLWRLTSGECHRLCRTDEPEIRGVFVNGQPFKGARQRLLDRILSTKPERVAVHGRQYLLATSSGSARRGVLHAHRPETDPVRRALTLVGCDRNTSELVDWERVNKFEQGSHCTTRWNACYELASDGELELKRFWFGSMGEVGELHRPHVEGGTYVIQLYEGWDGIGGRRQVIVAMRDGVDRQRVAVAILDLVRTKARLGSIEWRHSLTPDRL